MSEGGRPREQSHPGSQKRTRAESNQSINEIYRHYQGHVASFRMTTSRKPTEVRKRMGPRLRELALASRTLYHAT